MSEKVQKSGAIILSAKNKANIAILYRGLLNDWSFPKGHVEQGENSIETMIREIKEETGLDVDIIKELPNHFYSNKSERNISTSMFLVISKDDSKIKIENEKDEIEWIPYEDVAEKLSYENLKEYYNSVLPIIKEHIES
jgi:bis(5'-nucleosidyl)-tetraphosphatase